MQSFPTPEGVASLEILGPHFSKVLLPGGSVNIFTQPDFGPPHDHPYSFTTHIVAGGYTEEVYELRPDGTHSMQVVERRPGTSHHVDARTVHRITHLPAGFCVTRTEAETPSQTSGFYELRADGIGHRFWHEQDFKPWPRA